MKKLFCVLLLVLVLPGAGAVSARGAVVIDADTGETLFEQNADARLPMASTTKIMTALVALGEGDLDRIYTVKPEYAAVEGSSMYLQAGERLSLRDTLYGLMLASGNDAAVAIAGECGGMSAFVGKMNAKAAELGLTDTHFDNPNGLPSDTHYTTAHELAKITAAALKDPVFRQIVSTKSCTVSGHTLTNHNRLLSMYDGAVGVKTGFTRAAGRCLVSAAERNGRTLIAVTLNDPNDWNDHMEMLDAGFAQYSEVTLHTAGETITNARVFGGDTASVPLIAKNTVTAYLLPGEKDKLERVRYGEKLCYAPVVRTAHAGSVEYRLGDAVLARDTLVYGGESLLPVEEKGIVERIIERITG
ncbi:D-alanyl-D-alanine carboxypeptidase family protein [uncultured Agathobaculum sp.]|uniref:D-alanyl-D-alanine carboxypeptidase family protein n=1 Tax=uncultured Agathobaculum sp. TaxID=2048140 RepID=UPI00296E329B